MKEKNREETMDIPEEDIFSVSKLYISEAIRTGLKTKNLTVRELGDKIKMFHPQIVRVTNCKNYNIETLLKVLDGLDLEISIKSKK